MTDSEAQSPTLARVLLPQLEMHTLFSLQSDGIDKNCSLCFDQSFGTFAMCNVDLSTSPKESGLFKKLLLQNNFLPNTRVQNN